MAVRLVARPIAQSIAEGVSGRDVHWPGADGGGSAFPDTLCWEDGVTILCEDGADLETEA